MRRSPSVALLAMLGAAALWGASGGIVAELGVNGAAAASVVELLAGVLLSGLGRRGLRPVVTLLRGRLVLLAAVEAVNVLCYYVALQLAPVGPVMALHLAAPVLLTLVALARGTTRPDGRSLAALILVAAALLLIATARGDNSRYPQVALGLGLSLFSAVCLAFFVHLVSRSATTVSPVSAAGAQMFLSGLLLSPSLVLLDGSALTGLTLLGLCLFSPACWLYWIAMRRLSPIAGSTVLLAEPLFGTLTALAVFGQRPSLLHGAAMLLVVAATYLSLPRPDALHA